MGALDSRRRDRPSTRMPAATKGAAAATAVACLLLVSLTGCFEHVSKREPVAVQSGAFALAAGSQAACAAPDGCHAYGPRCQIAACYCPRICGSEPWRRAWAQSADGCDCGSE